MNYTDLFLAAKQKLDHFKLKNIPITPDEAFKLARNEMEISERKEIKQLTIFAEK